MSDLPNSVEIQEKRRARREIALSVRKLLVEKFPACFAPKGAAKQPLKRGIHRDVRAALPALSMRQIKIALADYTRGSTYLRAMVVGAERVGIDGKPCGFVAEDDAGRASRQLSSRLKYLHAEAA